MNQQSKMVFYDRYALRNPKGELMEMDYSDLCTRLSTRFTGEHEDAGEFFGVLNELEFVPGGRILSSTAEDATLFNCFVIPIEDDTGRKGNDSKAAIMCAATNMMEIAARGGGVGINWSVIRPEGSHIAGVNGTSSGAISWMRGVDALADQIRQGGTRTAALMWMLNDWHPDIPKFLDLEERFLRANFSIGISDKFMQAAEDGKLWDFEFPDTTHDAYDRDWEGHLSDWKDNELPVKLWGEELAYNVLTKMCISAHQLGSPGMVFLDTANRMSNTWYTGRLIGTNPCVTGDTLVATVEGQIPIQELVGEKIDVYCVNSEYELTISTARNIRKTRKNASLMKVVTTKGNVVCTPDHQFYTRNRGYVAALDLNNKDKITMLHRTAQNEHYAKVWISGTSAQVTGEHRFLMQHYYGDLTGMDVHHLDGNKLNNAISNLEVLPHGQHSIDSNVGHPEFCRRDNVTGQFIPGQTREQSEALSNCLNTQSSTGSMKIIEVVPLDYIEDVYDLEVDMHHNFFANQFLIHNCGEQILPTNGSCNLGSINLTKMYDYKVGDIDLDKLADTVETSVRFLDRVTDISKDVTKAIGDRQRAERRVGLGTMGFADLLLMLGVRYGSKTCMNVIDSVWSTMRDAAYRTSVDLAVEEGSAPALDREKFLTGGYMRTMPDYITEAISAAGIRNLALLSQAPTGTTSILAGVSSGIEPIFASHYRRTDATGEHDMVHPMFEEHGEKDYFVTAHDIPPEKHIMVQANIQRYVDSAVSKTINMPACSTIDSIRDAYRLAWKTGCRGITVYVDGSGEGVCEVCEIN